MSILLIILAILLVVILVVVFAGMAKSRLLTLEESVTIDKPLTDVFPEVSSLRNFVTWSPWSDKDPDMKQEFSGEDGEPGFIYSWKGNKAVGTGSMEIKEVIPGSLVVLAINFGNRGNAKSAFILQEMDNATKVTWSFESDMGNAFMRGMMSGMIAKFIRKDYQQGLRNLKKKLENQ